MYVRKIKLGDDVLLLPDSTEALATKADYEEGNWTPRISLTPNGSQLIATNFNGKYKRIGNEVHIRAYLYYQPGIETSNKLYLQGLPFDPHIYANTPMKHIFTGKAIIDNVIAKKILSGVEYLIIELPSEKSASLIEIDIIYWI